MTSCPVCNQSFTRASLKTGVNICPSDHRWYYCKLCRHLKINIRDDNGYCPDCSPKECFDSSKKSSTSRNQSLQSSGGARLGIMKNPETFADTRFGGRIDNNKVNDHLPTRATKHISTDRFQTATFSTLLSVLNSAFVSNTPDTTHQSHILCHVHSHLIDILHRVGFKYVSNHDIFQNCHSPPRHVTS